jgi:predicted  nucleic acid-binding Zn-ribbon protein
MFVGLEESMARSRRKSRVSVKPVYKEVENAVKELKKIRSKASDKNKKILDLGITMLDTANKVIRLACRAPMNV